MPDMPQDADDVLDQANEFWAEFYRAEKEREERERRQGKGAAPTRKARRRGRAALQ
jgi:hypothetical protein